MKKHLLLNQLFGTVDSPNHTDETPTRLRPHVQPWNITLPSGGWGLTSRATLAPLSSHLCAFLLTITLAVGNLYAEKFYIIAAKANIENNALKAGNTATIKANDTKVNTLYYDGSNLTPINTGVTFSTISDTEAALYYNSTTLSYSSLKTSSNYGTSSSASRTMSAYKLAGNKGSSCTVTFSKGSLDKATVIYRFINADNSNKLTIANVEQTAVTTNTTITSTEFTIHADSTTFTVKNSGVKDVGIFIILTPSAASSRTFKSGEVIYFKDSWKSSGNSGNWKVGDGGNAYAYFWNSKTDYAWAAVSDPVEGSWDGENAIYPITVPGTGKEYTKVIFTRGKSETFDGDNFWNKTTDEQPAEGKNLFYVSNEKYGVAYKGSWGNFTPAGKTVYFDNRNVTDWTTAYFRIGHGTWNNVLSMSKVAGTKHLYATTTTQFASHTDFAVANAEGYVANETYHNNIYQPWDGQSWTGNESKQITQQTNYQKYAIENDIYLCPMSTSMLERECQYYKVNGSTSTNTFDESNTAMALPEYTVTATATNCTVALQKCTDYSAGTYTSLTSGGTVMPTQYVKVTVTPNSGYQFSSVEVTGAGTETAAAAGTPGVYYITGDATITATCTCVPLTLSLGGDAATPAGGADLGTSYTLTCIASTGVITSYQWKQNTTASTTGAVNAEGTGATTASFNPNPASAGSYYYYCVATDACGNTQETALSGAFQFNAPGYTVTYDANGGSGTVPTDGNTYAEEADVTVLGKNTLAKEGYMFVGWRTAASSGTWYAEGQKMKMGDANVTLYAQWRSVSCPLSGTIYSLEMGNVGTAVSIATNDSVTLETHATISNGTAVFINKGGESGKATISSANPGKIYFNGNAAALKIELGCALQEGDSIKFVVTEKDEKQLSITTTNTRSETPATSRLGDNYLKFYKIPAESNLIGKKVIYVWRAVSNGIYVTSVAITRPPAETKTITIKFKHDNHTEGWTFQGKKTYPADQEATIAVEGDWVVMTFSDVYAVSNIDLACAGGDWDYLNTDTQITDDACYEWNGTVITSCATTYTLTASATVANEMTDDSKTGAITGSFTGNPVSGISSGTTVTVSGNTFTVSKATPATVTAAETIEGTSEQCDECTYRFDSWENVPATVTADVSTIHAVYKTTYTINFYETGGTEVADIAADDKYYVYGEGKTAAALPTPTKSGYTFGGWYKENTLSTAAGDIDGDAWGNVTYYAKWDVASATHNVTYNANGATSGSVPTDEEDYSAGDIVTVLGNTGNLTKSGSSFVGWSTSSTAGSGTFYPAGYKFTMGASNVTLYAVYGTVGTQCITLTDFETSNHGNSSNKPDSQSKYIFGYKGTKDAAHAVTITTANTNNKGQSSGAELRLYHGSFIRIYADNTTDGTPTGYTGVTAISFNWKFYNSGNNTISSSYTVKVGSTAVASNVAISGTNADGYQTATVSNISSLDGYVEIHLASPQGANSNYNLYIDDIQICTGSGSGSGYTVTFNNNGEGSFSEVITNVPDGSKIGAPIPAPTAYGNTFGGWYKETGCTNAWAFATGTVTSDLTLYAKWTDCLPGIATQPVGATYNKGTVASALTVVPSGAVERYQWYSNDENNNTTGTPIESQTTGGYTPETSVIGTTYYYCVVSNACGSVASDAVAIVVNDGKEEPCAAWTIAEPTHGGQGFSFSVTAYKHDGSTLWDGTLEASMLSVSEGVVLGTVTVNSETQTISGTYGVAGSATSSVTFYLTLPATGTQSAATLSQEQTFSICGSSETITWDFSDPTATKFENTKSYSFLAGDGSTEMRYTANSSEELVAKTYNKDGTEKASGYLKENGTTGSASCTDIDGKTAIGKTRLIRLFVSGTGKLTINCNSTAGAYKVYEMNAAHTASLGDALISSLSAGTQSGAITTTNGLWIETTKKGYITSIVWEQEAAGSAPDKETTLGWSNSQTDGATVEKNENAAAFVITATRSDENALASLGAITYTCSDASVATVDARTGEVTIADNIDFGGAEYKETTITATLAASGCYKSAQITYTLRVNKYVCQEAAGTIAVTGASGCGKELTLSGYETGASIQWYRDGEAISGATGESYTAAVGGTYYAVTHKECDAVSNELKVSVDAATATKIVDEWYVKKDRRTPDIPLVQTENATGFTVSPTEIGGCTFYLGEDGIVYLKGQKENGDEPAHDDNTWAEEDVTVTITATACTNASPVSITIHKQAVTTNPEIAFVVDGTAGGAVNNVTAEKTSKRAIWTYLSESFTLTGCNVYWSVNSKELRQYYSQFDAILITDDPDTGKKSGSMSYVQAFGTMVDVRPVLTMEAYVGKFTEGGWHVYNATPTSPDPRQVEMKLECKNHEIFAGLDPNTSTNVRTETVDGNEYWYVTMVDTTTHAPYHNTTKNAEDLPALQGFDRTKFGSMLGVGTIKNDELQAGVERQEEPAARMIILGIQSNAMAALTYEGKLVVKNTLDYLLKTDMEDVNDCSNYFIATVDNQWSNAANWTRGEVPDFETRARILRPVVVPTDYSTRVARVDIASSGKSKKLDGAECTGSVTIAPLGALVVGGKVSRVKAPYYGIDNLMPTEVGDLAILSGTLGNGTLIMDDAGGANKAFVQMYSKAQKGATPTTWQYIGVPHSDVSNAMSNYYDSWLYSWSPANGWEVVPRGGAVEPWTGYCITHPTYGHTYDMEGTLVATGEVDIEVPANSYQIIGNSWVAPIQIERFEDEDFGDIPKTVYFFNTGSDPNGTGTVNENAAEETRYAAGTYTSVPIHMAEYTGVDRIIPSLQGFYVANTGEAGTLHLDYDKLVRQGGVSNYIQGQMHAPRRNRSSYRSEDEPLVLKMVVSGSRYDDRLIVAERGDFTKGYDDGWDGEKWDGSTVSPTIWSENEEGGVEAVTATPDMEGTIIGFRAGEDDEYTFHFDYDDEAEALYLLDTDEKMYVRIMRDATYTFTCADKGEHNRFLLTRKAPGISTGVGDVQGGNAQSTKAVKFLKDNQLFILLNGALYDATGKIVVR